MRLDKYLADLRLGSRQEVKQKIKKGLVSVDGKIIRDPAFGVSPENNVTLNGEVLHYRSHYYYMLNKPAGVLTAAGGKIRIHSISYVPVYLNK